MNWELCDLYVPNRTLQSMLYLSCRVFLCRRQMVGHPLLLFYMPAILYFHVADVSLRLLLVGLRKPHSTLRGISTGKIEDVIGIIDPRVSTKPRFQTSVRVCWDSCFISAYYFSFNNMIVSHLRI